MALQPPLLSWYTTYHMNKDIRLVLLTCITQKILAVYTLRCDSTDGWNDNDRHLSNGVS